MSNFETSEQREKRKVDALERIASSNRSIANSLEFVCCVLGIFVVLSALTFALAPIFI